MAEEKICFVIAPIGEDGSDVRLQSDQLLEFVIKLAVEPLGYTALRADKIEASGLINTKVIRHLDLSPLVIANLTGSNPNVFYELAIRHALAKPVIQLLPEGEEVPFDLADMPTIRFADVTDPKVAAQARKEIVEFVQHIEQRPREFDTPISLALGGGRSL